MLAFGGLGQQTVTAWLPRDSRRAASRAEPRSKSNQGSHLKRQPNNEKQWIPVVQSFHAFSRSCHVVCLFNSSASTVFAPSDDTCQQPDYAAATSTCPPAPPPFVLILHSPNRWPGQELPGTAPRLPRPLQSNKRHVYNIASETRL